MAYIQRNNDGQIIALFETPHDDAIEELPLDSPELLEYLIKSANSADDAKAVLSTSDYSLIRVIEDVVNTLIDKNLIRFTDLPLAAQEKLSNREKVRGHINHLDNLIADDEQGLL